MNNLLNEIRIYSGNYHKLNNDNLEVAYGYLWGMELQGRIDNADAIIERLKGMGFNSTQDIIDYCINDNQTSIIGWQ